MIEKEDKFQEIVNKWIKKAEEFCENSWRLNECFREALWEIYDENFAYSAISIAKSNIQELVESIFEEWFAYFEETDDFEINFWSRIKQDVEQLFVDEEDVNEKIVEIEREIYFTILNKKYDFIEEFVKDAVSYTNKLIKLEIKYEEKFKDLLKNENFEKDYLGCSFYEILEKVKEEFINNFNFAEEYERFQNNPIVRAINGDYRDFLLKKFKDMLVGYLSVKNLKREEILNFIKNDLEKLAQKHGKDNFYLDIARVETKIWDSVVRNYENEIEKYFDNNFGFLFM
jgi:hypothetical protein